MEKIILTIAPLLLSVMLNAQNLQYTWADQFSNGPVPCTISSFGRCLSHNTVDTVSIISAGVFQTTFPCGIDFDPGLGSVTYTSTVSPTSPSDMYISKIQDGNVLDWAIQIGGTGEETPTSIISNGTHIFVTGYFTLTADFDPGAGVHSLTSAGGTDVFIAKYDLSGNYVWAKRIGGAGSDSAMSIAFDPIGGDLLVGGTFQGTVDFDPSALTTNMTSTGPRDAFFCKYSSTICAVFMKKKIGGIGNESISSITTDPSGNIAVCGYFETADCDFDPGAGVALPNSAYVGNRDAFVAKYNTVGTLIWERNFGTVLEDKLQEVIADASGNIYFVGGFGGGNITFPTIPSTTITNLTVAPFIHDIVLGSYNSAGTIKWVESYGSGSFDDAGVCIALDDANHVYISGYFQGTCDFDFSPSTASVVAANRDIYIARYNKITGAYNDVDAIQGPGMDRSLDICLYTPFSALYITGSYGGNIPSQTDFNTAPAFSNDLDAWSTQEINAFLARYNYSTLPLKVKASGEAVQHNSAYPNPTTGTLFIENMSKGSVAEIYNLNGENMGRWPAEGTTKQSMDISHLADGFYFLKIINADGGSATEKIILQR
ncbi:MAG: T9SS type A sorting domain-containing protein [Bacteroidia bacterium]|nr:T9SS type A sorting domain-containing protein [Bacteroidia bacterium]